VCQEPPTSQHHTHVGFLAFGVAFRAL
jgi:hypothetical protein